MAPRTFALVCGIAYLGLGVLGMMPGMLSTAPADAPAVAFDVQSGWLLGLFPVNMLANLVHLWIGLWGLMAFAYWARPGFYARACFVICVLLALVGAIPFIDTLFGVLPLYGNSVWLHLGTGVVAAATARMPSERRRSTSDRRTKQLAVAHERRRAQGDRRRAVFSP